MNTPCQAARLSRAPASAYRSAWLLALAFFASCFAASSVQAQWTRQTNGNIISIFYNNVQYAALHTNDSYFRLNYGPASGWGTSVIITPSFWSGGILRQGTAITPTFTISNGDYLIGYSGTKMAYQITGSLRLKPPTNNQIRALVSVSVSGVVALDNRPGEAYRPVFLSSMHISPTQWDTNGAYNGVYYSAIPVSGLIFSSGVKGSQLTLDGGSNAWKTNAPTIDILFDRTLTTMGWVTQSNDPNDDNVGYWLGANSKISNYSYTIVCRAP